MINQLYLTFVVMTVKTKTPNVKNKSKKDWHNWSLLIQFKHNDPTSAESCPVNYFIQQLFRSPIDLSSIYSYTKNKLQSDTDPNCHKSFTQVPHSTINKLCKEYLKECQKITMRTQQSCRQRHSKTLMMCGKKQPIYTSLHVVNQQCFDKL